MSVAKRQRPVRHQLFLPAELSGRIEDMAREPGVTKSQLLEAAVTAWLERRGFDPLEQRFAVRLDTMSRQLARIERDGHVVLESFALFVRYMLAAIAPVAETDATTRQIARERYLAFVDRVGRQVASGRRAFDPGDER